MKSAETKKENKKKTLIIVLLLFAIIGLAGYGVYSYYYAQGEYNGYSDMISVKSFNPQIEIEEDSDFLGNGGKVEITCPDTKTGRGSVTCTGSLEVKNNGAVPIEVEVLDASSGEYHIGGDITLDISNPEFNWTSRTLGQNESATLDISVPVDISSEFGSNEASEVSSVPYTGASMVRVGFKLKATQSHE